MLITLAACTGTKSDVTALLERAESFLPASPDSAEVCLDSLGDGWTSLGSDGRALYGLLRTMTDAMQGRGIKSDSLIRPTYIYYKEQMDGTASVLQPDILKRRYARSALYFGRFLEDCDSIKHAEDLYREAITYSEQVEDWRTCYLAYYYLGIRIRYSDMETAVEIQRNALSIYDRIQDNPTNRIYILKALSSSFVGLEQYDSALVYSGLAYQTAFENNMMKQKMLALKSLSITNLYIGNTLSAIEYAKQSLQLCSDDVEYPSVEYQLAECYYAADSASQAWNLYSRLKQNENIDIRYISYLRLSKLALDKQDFTLSSVYFDSAQYSIERKYYDAQIQIAQYYEDLMQQRIKEEQLRTHHAEYLLRLFTCILIFVAFTFILLWKLFKMFNNNKSKRKRSIKSQREYIHRENRVKQEYKMLQKQLSSVESVYQHDILDKQKEIEEIRNHMSDEKVSYNTNMDKMVYTTKQLQQRLSAKELEIEKISIEYVKTVRQLQQKLYTTQNKLEMVHKKQIQSSAVVIKLRNEQITYTTITKHDWDELNILLDSFSNMFVTRLVQTYPDISARHREICMLMRAGLPRKKIASFYCKTEETIRKWQRSIKQDIMFVKTAEPTIEQLIQKF